MDVPGICSQCGREAAPAHSCILCGALVCQKCFFPEKGTCKKCSSKEAE